MAGGLSLRPVSGDYCDLVTNNGDLYFMVGDVSGKGVAASMLMANLHAMFRVLIPAGLPLPQLVERASRVFCESTLPTQFATLVCGKANVHGEVEICNAGHPQPFLVGAHGVTRVDSAGLPIGIFSDQTFNGTTIQLAAADSLVIYTDGVSEAENEAGTEYGAESLETLWHENRSSSPGELVDRCMQGVRKFCGDAPKLDDQTILGIRFGAVGAA